DVLVLTGLEEVAPGDENDLGLLAVLRLLFQREAGRQFDCWFGRPDGQGKGARQEQGKCENGGSSAEHSRFSSVRGCRLSCPEGAPRFAVKDGVACSHHPCWGCPAEVDSFWKREEASADVISFLRGIGKRAEMIVRSVADTRFMG